MVVGGAVVLLLESGGVVAVEGLGRFLLGGVTEAATRWEWLAASGGACGCTLL